MKNPKIQFYSLICILLLIVVSGCGGSGGGSNNPPGGNNPPSGPTALNWQSLDTGLASNIAQGLSKIVVNQGIPLIACRYSTDVSILKYDGSWGNIYREYINTTLEPMEGSPSITVDAFNQIYLACKGTASGAQGIGFWKYADTDGKFAVRTMTGGVNAVEPFLSRNSSILYLLSRDSSTSSLTVTSLTIGATSWTGLSDFGGTCEAADLEVFNDYPYIAFKSLDTGDLFVKKYSANDGESGAWDSVGSPVATAIGDFAFDIDSTGTVYTVFTNTSGQVAVKKYNTGTTNWETVGPAEYLFSGNADNVTIFIAGTTPYIAYRDVTNDQIKVRKFADNAWLGLGSFSSEEEGVSLPTQLDLSLYVDGNVVYAAYMRSGHNATVKKGQ